MRRNTIVLIAVVFILAAVAWAGWANWEFRKQAAERQLAAEAQGVLVPDVATGTLEFKTPLMDKPAPAFALNDLSGKKMSLSSYRGKALLINFWATWCGPCRVETPWLVELQNKYATQGFEVLGIDTEGDDLQESDKAGWAKDEAAVNKFVAEMKVLLSDIARWRLDQPRVRRARRSAYIVLRGSQREGGRCTGGPDIGERDRGKYQEGAEQLSEPASQQCGELATEVAWSTDEGG